MRSSAVPLPELLALLDDASQRPVAQPERRQRAAQQLGRHHRLRLVSGEHLAQQAVADLPDLEGVEGDGDGLGELVGLERGRDVEPLAQEGPHRVHEEADQLLDREVLAGAQRQVTGEQWRHGTARADRRPGAGQGSAVEAERPLDRTPQVGDLPLGRVCRGVARLEVAGVVGLERVPGEDGVDHGRRGRAVGGVEQLPERYGGWSPRAGVLVGAGVGDHEVLGGGHHRVEQQLAVLAATVALARLRPPGQHVVTVGDSGPREDAVVEPEQADDAVRHRAHRDHRADGEGAGAEVGAGGPAGQPAGEQGPDVGQAEVW